MNLIDRYLLREWLKMLGLVLGACLGLLLMQAMYDDFRDLLQDGAGMQDVVIYYMIKLPSYLSVVLPLALLVSLLYTLGLMHRNHEFTALRAAGVGVFRITRSIWLAGLALCAVTWYINATVIPWSVEESRVIRENLEFSHDMKNRSVDRVGMKASVAFDNRKDGRMWFFNRYSQFTRKGYGVTLVELDGQRRETKRLLAREAWLDSKRGWVFRDGREIVVSADGGEVESTTQFGEIVRRDFKEDPTLMLIFDARPQDLSFTELRRLIAYFSVDENPKLTAYQVRYYGVLAETLGPLIIIALAIPFAVSGVRVNPVVGVSKALGLFVVYFVLLKLFGTLGARDVIPALWAALLPSLAMLGAGLVLLARLR
ncbi:MAG: LptF/LptG family permease [Opitutaceae bacterium]|nr:LptF/LptG family permease [Opitutaceae bacterium]